MPREPHERPPELSPGQRDHKKILKKWWWKWNKCKVGLQRRPTTTTCLSRLLQSLPSGRKVRNSILLLLDSTLTFVLRTAPSAAASPAKSSRNPVTPTCAARSPLTPPPTPRRVVNRPPVIISPPPAVRLTATYSDESGGSMSPCGSDGSSDTLASNESRRDLIFTTPPQHSRSVFDDNPTLPPSPVTPSSRFGPRKTPTQARPTSPRGHRTPPPPPSKSSRPVRSIVRRRKESPDSADSSSSSSGTSSMPPTPTGPLIFNHPVIHHSTTSSSSSVDGRLANQVRIVNVSSDKPHFPSEEDMQMQIAHNEQAADLSSKPSYIAFYPYLADWADNASNQQSQFAVTVPSSFASGFNAPRRSKVNVSRV